VRDALAAGVTETGVTIHIVDNGVDTGEQIAQARVPIEKDDNEYDLHERIKLVERKLLVETIRAIAAKKLSAQPANRG
jgi:phosphoribosylglycinamide formyltransferase-1